jgi:hypothetical protein
MSAIEVADYQHGVVHGQKLLASETSGTSTVTVTLPANTQTLVVVFAAGGAVTQVTCVGQTTSLPYPGTLLDSTSKTGSSTAFYFSVAQQIDAQVTVTVTGGPGGNWWVYADSAVHTVANLRLASGGGGATNTVQVHKLAFQYNSANISTTGAAGFSIYTPTSGDILLDAWVEVNTPWNGTTPNGDIGWSGANGLFAFPFDTGEGLNMTNTELQYPGQSGNNQLTGNNLSSLRDISNFYNLTLGIMVVSGTSIVAGTNPLHNGVRLVPFRFTSATPLKIWVTQNGASNGTNPGATQGTGTLFLATATPS